MIDGAPPHPLLALQGVANLEFCFSVILASLLHYLSVAGAGFARSYRLYERLRSVLIATNIMFSTHACASLAEVPGAVGRAHNCCPV